MGPPLVPAAAGALPFVSRSTAAWVNVLTMPLSAIAAIAVAIRVTSGGSIPELGVWRIDALSALLAVLIALVATLAAWLVPVRRSKAAVEASWKYLIIGSVGIALAFAGTVLAFVDYASTGGNVNAALNWTTLRAAAPALHPEVARLAFAFLLVGFGTKAGLAPMHTWLPDAHSEAPAPR